MLLVILERIYGMVERYKCMFSISKYVTVSLIKQATKQIRVYHFPMNEKRLGLELGSAENNARARGIFHHAASSS